MEDKGFGLDSRFVNRIDAGSTEFANLRIAFITFGFLQSNEFCGDSALW